MAFQTYRTATLDPSSSLPIKITYLDTHPSSSIPAKKTILLLHGFPQTPYQFRHAIPLLTAAGYRCIAPIIIPSIPTATDRIGLKTTLATNLIRLLDHLSLRASVHVIGHDIGGMVAYTLASRHPSRVRSVIWGECPLPGTQTYYRDVTEPERLTQQFHFVFHRLPDFASSLVSGHERLYIEHFLSKISHVPNTFTEEDIDVYVAAYSRPGAMKNAMQLYAAFETDAAENTSWTKEHAKCPIPCMVLSGEMSYQRAEAEEMAREVFEDEVVEVGVVEGAGHYLAEENPKGFVEVVEGFFGRH